MSQNSNKLGRKAGNASRVFEQFTRHPLLSASQLSIDLALPTPTIRRALDVLGELKLINEITGQRRNRVWLYQDYYSILSEGAGPL